VKRKRIQETKENKKETKEKLKEKKRKVLLLAVKKRVKTEERNGKQREEKE